MSTITASTPPSTQNTQSVGKAPGVPNNILGELLASQVAKSGNNNTDATTATNDNPGPATQPAPDPNDPNDDPEAAPGGTPPEEDSASSTSNPDGPIGSSI